MKGSKFTAQKTTNTRIMRAMIVDAVITVLSAALRSRRNVATASRVLRHGSGER